MKELTIVNAEIASADQLKDEIESRIETLVGLKEIGATKEGKEKVRNNNSKFIKECRDAVKAAKDADKKAIESRYANAESQLNALLSPLVAENSKLDAELKDASKEAKKKKYIETFVIPNLHGANDKGIEPNPYSFWREGDEKKTSIKAAADYGTRIRVFYGDEPTYSTSLTITGITKQQLADILDFARSVAPRASFLQGETNQEGE